PQMLALTHELEAAQSGRSSRGCGGGGGGGGGGGPAIHDVGTRVVVVERGDRRDLGFRLPELEEQAGELLEFGAFGVGPTPFGDLARAARDRGRRGLEQLADLRRRLEPG